VDARRSPEWEAQWAQLIGQGEIPQEWIEDFEERHYPMDEHRAPILSHFTQPVRRYVELYEQHLAFDRVYEKHLKYRWHDWSAWPQWMYEAATNMYDKNLLAVWGMIAKGAESVPNGLELLRRDEPDARADGASVLGAVGRQESIVDEVIAAAEALWLVSNPDRETLEAVDSMIIALAQLRNRRAIPLLARIIRSGATDGDTRWTAAEALGTIVRRKFKHPDPVSQALAWLEKNGL
jgi:hypothetical protein